jgi:hypothetical protein
LLKHAFIIAAIVAVELFLALYVWHYFADLTQYYILSAIELAALGQFFILFFMVIFFLTTVIFYVGGFLVFVLETRRGFKTRG